MDRAGSGCFPWLDCIRGNEDGQVRLRSSVVNWLTGSTQMVSRCAGAVLYPQKAHRRLGPAASTAIPSESKRHHHLRLDCERDPTCFGPRSLDISMDTGDLRGRRDHGREMCDGGYAVDASPGGG